MSNSKLVKPNVSELLSIVPELMPRDVIKEFVKKSGVKLYWRLLTPLIIVWCFIYQRLEKDHTCDEVVSHLLSGVERAVALPRLGADDLDLQEQDKPPLSQRLQSENTSAVEESALLSAFYVQGRNRLPLSVLQDALLHVSKVILGWLRDEKRYWKGHAVRWLDGTTMRLRPFGDLQETYKKAKNQHGVCYWVVARVLAAFCLHSEAIVAATEASTENSEPAMVREVMMKDPEKNAIYVGDQGLGVYRTVQTAEAMNHKVVLRLKKRMAKQLWKSSKAKAFLVSGSEHNVTWKPFAHIKAEPGLPREPINGRLIMEESDALSRFMFASNRTVSVLWMYICLLPSLTLFSIYIKTFVNYTVGVGKLRLTCDR
jgi:hypothetical protein